MDEQPGLEELAERAQVEPERLDYRTLCRYLASDTYEESSQATEVRDIAIRELDDPEAVFDTLWPVLVDDRDPIRRAAVETLNRVVRVWPRRLTPLLAEGLNAADVRRRAAAGDVLGRLPVGAVRPHTPALLDSLDDPDERVQAHSLSALSNVAVSFPELLAPELESIRPFLADRWVSEDRGGMQVIYSADDDETNEESGEPAGPRLTNRVPRTFDDVVSLLAEVALSHPDAASDFVPRLAELATSGAPWVSDDLLSVLERVERSDPDAIEPALPTVEEWATSDSPMRVRSRNLLRELGRDLPLADPVPAPDGMTPRDRPPEPDDEDVLDWIDQRAHAGEVDVDRVLPLLRSRDRDTRDTALWGLACGIGTLTDEIHERAETFLSLLDEPDDCAREHLLNLLGHVAGAHPEAWLPPLLELAEHEDPLVREGAVTLVGFVAGSSPSLVEPELDLVRDALAAESTRSAALFVLTNLAESSPETVREAVRDAGEYVEYSECGTHALRFLVALGRIEPDTVRLAIDEVTALIEDLAGETSVVARPQWGRESHVEGVDEAERSLEYAFQICALVAKTHPGLVEQVAPHAERVAEGRYNGYRDALLLLATLESEP